MICADMSVRNYPKAVVRKIHTATPLWLEACIAAKTCLPIEGNAEYEVGKPLRADIRWRKRFFEGLTFLLCFLPDDRLVARIRTAIWHGGGFTVTDKTDPGITHVVLKKERGRLFHLPCSLKDTTCVFTDWIDLCFKEEGWVTPPVSQTMRGSHCTHGAGGATSAQQAPAVQFDAGIVEGTTTDTLLNNRGMMAASLNARSLTNGGFTSALSPGLRRLHRISRLARHASAASASSGHSRMQGGSSDGPPGGGGPTTTSAGPPRPAAVSMNGPAAAVQDSQFVIASPEPTTRRGGSSFGRGDFQTPRNYGNDKSGFGLLFKQKLIAVNSKCEPRLNAIVLELTTKAGACVVYGDRIREHEKEVDWFIIDDGITSRELPITDASCWRVGFFFAETPDHGSWTHHFFPFPAYHP